MPGQTQSRYLIGSLALVLVLTGVLAACGERSSLAGTGVGPAVRLPPVAQITVPPGQEPASPAASPTPRVQQQLTSVSPTPSPHGDPACVFAPEGCITPTPAPSPAAPLVGAAEAGRTQFTKNGCIACHGADLSGGIGPQLSGRTADDLSDDRIRQQIMVGGSGMPAFPKTTRQELTNFVALIRSHR